MTTMLKGLNMKKETRVTDGATLRKSRLMGMFRYIADAEGATTRAIQSFMLMNYGLKFKTTSDYIHEANLSAGLVLTQNGEWIISKKFKKYLE